MVVIVVAVETVIFKTGGVTVTVCTADTVTVVVVGAAVVIKSDSQYDETLGSKEGATFVDFVHDIYGQLDAEVVVTVPPVVVVVLMYAGVVVNMVHGEEILVVIELVSATAVVFNSHCPQVGCTSVPEVPSHGQV